jgi:hypothetical protein
MIWNPKLLNIFKTEKANLFQQFVVWHYADAEHPTINHFVMAHMERLVFQVIIKLNDNISSEHLIRDKRKNYVGKEITIHDNRRICSHAQECVNNLSSVFKLNSRPWIKTVIILLICNQNFLSFKLHYQDLLPDGEQYYQIMQGRPLLSLNLLRLNFVMLFPFIL